MALINADHASLGTSGLSSLYHELAALQDAILNGQRPQYRLPAPALAKLQSSVSDLQTYKRRAPQDEGQRKRLRLERAIQEQGERHKNERMLVDVDSIFTQAQQLVPPVSGLKTQEEDKSSFDENDYYSSQVESKWSDDEAKPFTGDFESLQPYGKKRDARAMDSSEDEYIPDEPKPGVSPDDEPSDYEPGEVSQSDEYSPAYPPASDNEPRLKVKNHLTQIAAPQPNRISPMAMHKTYELELVNGRPEMVRKKYDTDARQSSASPPARQGRRKTKKRKKEEPTPLRQPKKRAHKEAGLDDSAQYPQFKSPKRAVSDVQPPRQEDLRRVATMHAQHEYSPYSPAGFAQPPVYRQPTVPPAMVPPRPYITAEGGVRYYPLEAQPYDRAPSRVSQYDPNNARIDYTQSVRPTAATPAYQDPRVKVRPPEYEPAPVYARPYAPPEYAYRQEAPQYYRDPRSVYPPDPHAYGAVREGLQVLYPPQPPPVAYAMPPDQHVRYVDARGYELPPHLRPATDARQY